MDPKQEESDTNIPKMNSIPTKDDKDDKCMPEADLQSLGFSLDNGRPRFKLDEPTMTGSTLGFTVLDEEDTLSFEILGKDSLHVIQELSHASYLDLQQKSKSIDYSSMVSTLNTSEIQSKLTELLQENVQLKETLKENNIAMKQQFNVLAMWQEEVMKVHQNHKQKFIETRELIHHLKKENAELKLKLSSNHYPDMQTQFKDIHESGYNVPKEETGNEVLSFGKTDESTVKVAKLDDVKQILQDVHKVLTLYNEKSSELKTAVRMLQNQNLQKPGINAVKNEADVSSTFSLLNPPSESIDIHTCIEKCLVKDEEVNQLAEAIRLLEQFSQTDCTMAQEPAKVSFESSTDHGEKQFVENVKQYEEKLQNLTHCFVTQIARSVTIQDCVRDCINTLESCGAICTLKDHKTPDGESKVLSPEEIKSFKDKIFACHKNLLDQQVKIISDRQNLIKAVNEVKKIFSEYNSMLYEYEILQQENVKLNTIQDEETRETLEKRIDFEKWKNKEMQSLEQEKALVAQEKHSLDETKKSIDNEKKMLEEERQNLEHERQLLLQERTNLHQEKVSLDQQSQLYESHEKALQAQRKVLENDHQKLVARVHTLEKDCEMMGALQKQIENQLQDIEVLEMQLSIYEEDFKQEKKTVQSLTTEKIKLTDELQRQIEINKACGRAQSTSQGGGNDRLPTTFSCPNCDFSAFGLKLLEQHVERCLNLQ